MKELDTGKDFEFLRLAVMGISKFGDKNWRVKGKKLGGIIPRLERLEPALSSSKLREKVSQTIKELDKNYEMGEDLRKKDADKLQGLVDAIEKDLKSSDPWLDGIDYGIIKELSDDFRVPEREISRKLGISPSTVNYRLKRIKEWLGFLPHADLKRFEKVTAIFKISTTEGRDRDIADEVASDARVYRVLVCSGEGELHIEGVFDDLLEIREFERKAGKIKGVGRVQSSVVLEEKKERGQLSVLVDRK